MNTHWITIFFIAATLFPPVKVLSQVDDPPPWESVEVVPKPTIKKNDRSPEVVTQYSKIEKITVYVESFCSDCEKVVSFLNDKGVKFDKQYMHLTFSGIPGILLGSEKPPIVIIEYTDGSKRKIIGFDKAILNASVESLSSYGNSNASEFDLRGDPGQDSFDLR